MSIHVSQVASETLHLLCLSKRQLDSFLGRDQGLVTVEQVIAALKKSNHLASLSDTQLKTMLGVGGSRKASACRIACSPVAEQAMF